MKLLNSSLSTSVFSLGKGGRSAAEALLPANALVIVIQDLPLSSRECPYYIGGATAVVRNMESLPVIRRKAERAYSESARAGTSVVNLSG
jgi:hypothetical protein